MGSGVLEDSCPVQPQPLDLLLRGAAVHREDSPVRQRVGQASDHRLPQRRGPVQRTLRAMKVETTLFLSEELLSVLGTRAARRRIFDGAC